MPTTSCVYAMPAILGNVIIMLPEEVASCSHYAQYVMGFNLWPNECGQARL